MDKERELSKDHGGLQDCRARGTGDTCMILGFHIPEFGFYLVNRLKSILDIKGVE